MNSPYLHPQITLHLADETATAALAARLARYVVAGDLILLEGDLGAGKTTFAGYFLRALGHVGEVPSPTYTLVQTYENTRVAVAHIDCYRLEDPLELEALDITAYRRFGVVLAEWPSKAGSLLAQTETHNLPAINQRELPGTLTLKLEAGGTGRTATLTGTASWQWRFAFLDGLAGLPEGLHLRRKITQDGRRAFLDKYITQPYTLTAMGGDWGGRCYARVALTDGTSRLLMDGPPPQENVVEAYARVADYYRSIGLRTAQNYAIDTTEGYLLQEDLGHTPLIDKLNAGDDCADWFSVAGQALVKQCESFKAHSAPDWTMRYSPAYWWAEAARLPNWLVPLATGKACTPEDFAHWQALWLPLYAKVSALPHGLMMWDCQSPNLMVLGDAPCLKNMALIDIQDARIAPVCQDLALLLRNIRSPQNNAVEQRVLGEVCAALDIKKDVMDEVIAICSLHHSCRILGGLARLYLRDANPAPARAYMARTWEVAKQSENYDILKPIFEFMLPLENASLQAIFKEMPDAV